MRKSNIILILFLLLLIILPLRNLLNYKYVWSGTDLIQFFYYNFDFTRKSVLLNQEFPFWNPFLFSGYPWFAAIQTGLLYPFTYLILIYNTELGLNLSILLHFIIGFAGAFYLTKHFVKNNIINSIAGILFIFNGFVVTDFNYGHITMLYVYFWMPAALSIFLKFLETKKNLYSILFSIISALMFFAGHPQIFYYFGFSIFIILLFNLKRIKFDFNIWLNIFLILIFIFLIILPQFFATFNLMKNSARYAYTSGYEFNTYFSLEPKHIIQTICPNFFGNSVEKTYWRNIWRRLTGFEEYTFFIGLVSAIFTFLSIIKVRNPEIVPFKFIFIFSVLCAFGKYTPFYKIVFYLIPGFKLFRWPMRIMSLYHLSNIILTAVGIETALKNKIFIKKKYFIFIIAILFCCAAALVFAEPMLHQKFENHILSKKIVESETYKIGFIKIYNTIKESVIRIIIIVTLLVVIVNSYIPENKKLYLILFLIYIELVSFSRIFFRVDDMSKYKNNLYDYLINTIEKSERILSVSKIEHLAQYHSLGISSVKGYEPLIYNKYVDYMSFIEKEGYLTNENIRFFLPDYTHPLFKFLNVKYIIDFENKIKLDKSIYYSDELKIYENKNRFGFYKVYNNYEYIDEKNFFKLDFAKLENILYLTQNAKFKNFNFNSNEIKSHLTFIQFKNNRIGFEFYCSENCLLLVSIINYPGWTAFDNGKKTELLTGNYLFAVIPIKKGNHIINLKYIPENFYLHIFISILTSIILIILFIIKFFSKQTSIIKKE